MSVIERQSETKATPQRLIFPPPARRNRAAEFLQLLRGLRPGVRGVALPIGTNQNVQCPQRGEIPVETCSGCPLLIRLTSKAGQAQVLCCVPRETFSAELQPSDRYLSGRMGFR